MKKRFVFAVCLFLLFSQLFVLVAAQTPLGLDAESSQNDSVVQGVDELRRLADKDRLEYLSEQWKGLFLKNEYIVSVDSFLKKWNWAFLFLFGRDYELSLVLLFSIPMWLITFFVLPRYFVFFKEKWMRYVCSFGATVIIAQIQIFNSLSLLLFRFYFYEFTWWWKTLSYLVVIVLLILYFGFLRYFGKIIEANRKKKEEKQAELDKRKLNTVAGELQKASRDD